MHISTRAVPSTSVQRVAVCTFGVTTFLASTLLFLVQPMFAKMALPKLGGSPAVWNACVVFFQATLLLGYLYAHLSVKWLGAQRQVLLQVALMVVAGFVLPLSVGDADPPPDSSPLWWLFKVLAIRLGLPFFALSTMAPLVQRWYAILPLRSAESPYFLYAASNTGSMLALLAYPFVLEPLWGTRTQAAAWAVGYLCLIVLAVVCAFWLKREGRELPTASSDGRTPWRTRLRWVALASVPSSLMLGVTTHISTDLASIPLLWVVPLAAYLLTFVIVFASRDRVPRRLIARVLPFLILAVLLSITFQFHPPWVIPLHLVAFFAIALTCHDELARSRPGATHLTEFYVWMSFGGMVGGVFNTIVAPVLFSGIFEYPIVLALACLVRASPQYGKGRIEDWGGFIASGVIPVGLSIVLWAAGKTPPGVSLPAVLAIAAILPALWSAAANRRAPFNLLVGVTVVALLIAAHTRSVLGDVVFAGRSFFGVTRVIEATDHSYHLLQHGTTLHGRQNLGAGSRCEPQAYYDADGPIGDLFLRSGRTFSDVAVVGLGSGGLACYARPGSHWTFFEIDPLMQQIARDTSLFTFLRNSAGNLDVVIGDGRKGLENTLPASFDLIILDAFSSDSLPVHLVTREAVAAYFERLRPGGIVAVHISNRYLDLEPVIASLAADERVSAITNQNLDIAAADAARGRAPSHWVLLSETPEALLMVRERPGWRALRRRDRIHAWSDDYSNLLGVLRMR
jgi:SAM-dependent methyltransferase